MSHKLRSNTCVHLSGPQFVKYLPSRQHPILAFRELKLLFKLAKYLSNLSVEWGRHQAPILIHARRLCYNISWWLGPEFLFFSSWYSSGCRGSHSHHLDSTNLWYMADYVDFYACIYYGDNYQLSPGSSNSPDPVVVLFRVKICTSQAGNAYSTNSWYKHPPSLRAQFPLSAPGGASSEGSLICLTKLFIPSSVPSHQIHCFVAWDLSFINPHVLLRPLILSTSTV